jgi:hypothetical protein
VRHGNEQRIHPEQLKDGDVRRTLVQEAQLPPPFSVANTPRRWRRTPG